MPQKELKIESPFGETYDNFERDYGCIDYNGKVVLDLGADRGSTAAFFLDKGARKVVAVEGNRVLANELKAIVMAPQWKERIIPVALWIKEPQDIENLISNYQPDVAKVDIEHWEILLVDCKSELLRKVPEWVMEIHRPDELRKLVDQFMSIGFETKCIKEYVWKHVTGVMQTHYLQYFRFGT